MYEEFTSAIDSIADLPKLQAVHIRISDRCHGDPNYDYCWESGTELISTRLQTLEAVFRSIEARVAQKKADNGVEITTVTSLAIQNLQNNPLPDFIASDTFQSVAKNLTDLRLLVAEECNESGPDHDLGCEERRAFEPWLQNALLPVFANQLTTLHLAFNEYWGVTPGYFDGKGLVFPNLKTLTLGQYVIGHHDQFDWVLAQHSLETLRLDQCEIVTYLNFLHKSSTNEGQLAEWNVPTHDWIRYPEWSFGFGERETAFMFPGTWEAVFDNIRTQLPNLVDLRMENQDRRQGHAFNRADRMRCTLSCLRYITLDTGLLSSPWIAARVHGGDGPGDMAFGNNDPAVVPLAERDQNQYVPKATLDRVKETFEGDSRAFNDLVRSVETRRAQRGLYTLA